MQRRMITSFNSRFLRPCRKHLIKLLRFPRSISIKPFKFLPKKRKMSTTRRRFRFVVPLRTALGLRRVVTDDIEMKSFGEPCRAPYPSPLTPAYVKLAAAAAARDSDEVEEACRSFESYLVEMMVEEGEVRDLMDVEELLYCWDGLKSPVFIELVSSFYGELCRDLFQEAGHYVTSLIF